MHTAISPTYDKTLVKRFSNATIKNQNSKSKLPTNNNFVSSSVNLMNSKEAGDNGFNKKSTSSLISLAKNENESQNNTSNNHTSSNFPNLNSLTKKPSTSNTQHQTTKSAQTSQNLDFKNSSNYSSYTNYSNLSQISHVSSNLSHSSASNITNPSMTPLNNTHGSNSNSHNLNYTSFHQSNSNIKNLSSSANFNLTPKVNNPVFNSINRITSPKNVLGRKNSGSNSNLLHLQTNSSVLSGAGSQNTTQTNSVNLSGFGTNNISPNKKPENEKERDGDKAKPNVQEGISVSSLISNQNIPLALSNLSVYFPIYEGTKCSTKSLGYIRAYAANTYQGIIRNYNEDRVSIILNIARSNNFLGIWPKCSFFGIYDGHGGSLCADFLKDHLHSYVIKDVNFPNNPEEALRRGFEKAEEDFIYVQAMTKNMEVLDKSGSCAVVALIVEDICYVANVGDSRAVLSKNGGKNLEVMTNDHKPNEDGENRRILENGGRVYQTQTPAKLLNMPNIIPSNTNPNQVLIGPYRVFPGRLSVSRTFGDVEAKIGKFNGIPGVVVATPEIKSFTIGSNSDFLVIGCDGIYDQLSNKDSVDCVWMTTKDESKAKDLHSQCALGVDMVMKSSLVRRTLDNVTVLLIAFQNFENIFQNSVKNKNENFSPKSSFYLYNVIENKEGLISQDQSGNYYCNTEPNLNSNEKERNSVGVNFSSNINYLAPNNGNYSRGASRMSRTNEDVKVNKVKSLSPKGREKIMYYNKTAATQNNNSKIGNPLMSSYDSHPLPKDKLNKVFSFEVNNKIVQSPKNKKPNAGI